MSISHWVRSVPQKDTRQCPLGLRWMYLPLYRTWSYQEHTLEDHFHDKLIFSHPSMLQSFISSWGLVSTAPAGMWLLSVTADLLPWGSPSEQVALFCVPWWNTPSSGDRALHDYRVGSYRQMKHKFSQGLLLLSALRLAATRPTC